MPSPPPASPATSWASKSVGLGCYNREFARDIRAAAKRYGVEPLITDDHLAVEDAIAAPRSPNWCSARRWSAISPSACGIPCAVISAPVHVQDFPARHSPADGL